MIRGPAPRDARWARAAAEHRASLDELLAALARVDAAAWATPARPGAWSPAQVAEHLSLTYESLLRELEGGGAMRPAVGGGLRTLFRWFLLPHVLFHRSFPLRARAPRELRPSPAGLRRDDARQRLAELAARWESAVLAVRDRDRRTLFHPYFGPVPLLRAFRFVTVHVEHHRRQIPTR